MSEPMQPEDVPSELADLAVAAWFNINDKAWGLEGLHRVMRICLAATLPEHERMVIERIACQPPGSVVISEAEYAALTDGLGGRDRPKRNKVHIRSLPDSYLADALRRSVERMARDVAKRMDGGLK